MGATDNKSFKKLIITSYVKNRERNEWQASIIGKKNYLESFSEEVTFKKKKRGEMPFLQREEEKTETEESTP